MTPTSWNGSVTTAPAQDTWTSRDFYTDRLPKPIPTAAQTSRATSERTRTCCLVSIGSLRGAPKYARASGPSTFDPFEAQIPALAARVIDLVVEAVVVSNSLSTASAHVSF